MFAKIRQRRYAALMALPLCSLLWYLEGITSKLPQEPPKKLEIVFTSDLNGQAGTTRGTGGKFYGGMRTFGKYLTKLRETNPSVKWIDGGNFSGKSQADTSCILKAFSDYGCNLIALGWKDLAVGMEALKRLVPEEQKLPFHCSNLRESGKPTGVSFGSEVHLQNGLKLAVCAVLDAKAEAGEDGLTALNPEDSAKRFFRFASPDALRIIVAQVGRASLEELCRSQARPQLVLAGLSARRKAVQEVIAGVPVVFAPENHTGCVKIDVKWNSATRIHVKAVEVTLPSAED